MKRLFEIADRYIETSDWKTIAVLTLKKQISLSYAGS